MPVTLWQMVRRVLDELLGTPGAAQHAVPQCPQLLSVDLRARHRALLETLSLHGLTGSDAAQVGSDCIVQLRTPRLSAVPPVRLWQACLKFGLL